jgi:hypothetical protein
MMETTVNTIDCLGFFVQQTERNRDQVTLNETERGCSKEGQNELGVRRLPLL